MPSRPSLALAALAAAAVLGGCGNASAPIAPTGVDELVIPTPSPAADDFVDAVDSPWLPLEPGARWVYDVTADGVGRPAARVTVEVADGPERDGIATTSVTTTVRTPGRGAAERRVDAFAQDRDGNVWRFAVDGRWLAEPGLAMPADPRLGDGFTVVDLAGGQVHAEITGLEESVEVPAGAYDDVLVLEVRGAPEGDRREFYAEEIGLVRTESLDGADMTAGLVRYDEPR